MKKCYRVKEDRNVLQTIKTRKNNWIDYVWRRNCLLRKVIEARIEGRICDRTTRKKT
jgi:hypothetical protein